MRRSSGVRKELERIARVRLGRFVPPSLRHPTVPIAGAVSPVEPPAGGSEIREVPPVERLSEVPAPSSATEQAVPGHLHDITDLGPPAPELAAYGSEVLVRELLRRCRSTSPGLSVRIAPFPMVMPGNEGMYVEIADGVSHFGELAPVLALELARRGELLGDNRFGRAVFQWAFATSPGVDIEDKTCVEIGCGSQNPLAHSMMYVLLGARRVLAVDADPPQDVRLTAWGVAQMASMMAADPRLLVEDWPVTREDVARRLEGFDVAKLWDGDLDGLDRSRVDLCTQRFERLPLADGEADLVFSNAVLEHVEDPRAVVAELARVVKPGGWTWHGIDGVDHRMYQDPGWPSLGFLREPMEHPMVAGCNRLRPLEFVDLFERHGFESVAVYPYFYLPVDDAERQGFAEPWRSMTDEMLAVRGSFHSFRRR